MASATRRSLLQVRSVDKEPTEVVAMLSQLAFYREPHLHNGHVHFKAASTVGEVRLFYIYCDCDDSKVLGVRRWVISPCAPEIGGNLCYAYAITPAVHPNSVHGQEWRVASGRAVNNASWSSICQGKLHLVHDGMGLTSAEPYLLDDFGPDFWLRNVNKKQDAFWYVAPPALEGGEAKIVHSFANEKENQDGKKEDGWRYCPGCIGSKYPQHYLHKSSNFPFQHWSAIHFTHRSKTGNVVVVVPVPQHVTVRRADGRSIVLTWAGVSSDDTSIQKGSNRALGYVIQARADPDPAGGKQEWRELAKYYTGEFRVTADAWQMTPRIDLSDLEASLGAKTSIAFRVAVLTTANFVEQKEEGWSTPTEPFVLAGHAELPAASSIAGDGAHLQHGGLNEVSLFSQVLDRFVQEEAGDPPRSPGATTPPNASAQIAGDGAYLQQGDLDEVSLFGKTVDGFVEDDAGDPPRSPGATTAPTSASDMEQLINDFDWHADPVISHFMETAGKRAHADAEDLGQITTGKRQRRVNDAVDSDDDMDTLPQRFRSFAPVTMDTDDDDDDVVVGGGEGGGGDLPLLRSMGRPPSIGAPSASGAPSEAALVAALQPKLAAADPAKLRASLTPAALRHFPTAARTLLATYAAPEHAAAVLTPSAIRGWDLCAPLPPRGAKRAHLNISRLTVACAPPPDAASPLKPPPVLSWAQRVAVGAAVAVVLAASVIAKHVSS